MNRSTAVLRRLVPVLSITLLGACADDISPRGSNGADPDPETPEVTLPGPGGPQARFVAHSSGYYQASIDASGSDWVYIDLETQKQVTPAVPEASADWDVAFKGVDIKLNGGVSGAPPTGQAVTLNAQRTTAGSAYPFEDVEAAPINSQATPYVSDAAGSGGLGGSTAVAYAFTTYPAADKTPNLLNGYTGDYGWYSVSRNLGGTEISARINAGYIVRSVECRYFKIRMTGYHAAGGAAGHPQFDLAEVSGNDCENAGDGSSDAAPAGKATFTVNSASTRVDMDASSEVQWTYLDLSRANQAIPATPRSDAHGWDIAMQRRDLKINGGSSGAGSLEIHAMLRDDWNTRSSVPAGADWHTDVADALAFQTYPAREIGGECATNGDGDYGWYYYSGFCNKGNGIHHISPRDVVYLVRGQDGSVWKLRMLDYYSDSGTSGFPTLEYAPITP